jgi:hypothetical protein
MLPLLALAFWVGTFFMQPSDPVFAMPLYNLLTKPLNNLHFVASIIAFIVVVAEAFLLNYIINENEILNKPTFLPALLYIVFMSCDTQLLTIYPLLFANFFILLAINRLMSSYRKDVAFSNAFDAGFLLSIATLFYFPCIVFLPLLIIGFILFRPFNWREWIISFIGTTVPYTFVFTYYFWNDVLDYWWNMKVFYPGSKQLILISPGFYFMISVAALLVLLSFGKLFVGFVDASQKNRKGISLLIWLFGLALLSMFLSPEISLQSFSALAIPASVFCANFFLRMRKIQWAELLFTLLFVTILINHVLSYMQHRGV